MNDVASSYIFSNSAFISIKLLSAKLDTNLNNFNIRSSMNSSGLLKPGRFLSKRYSFFSRIHSIN